MNKTPIIYKCEECGKEEEWDWGGDYIEHISPMGKGICGWMYPVRQEPTGPQKQSHS